MMVIHSMPPRVFLGILPTARAHDVVSRFKVVGRRAFAALRSVCSAAQRFAALQTAFAALRSAAQREMGFDRVFDRVLTEFRLEVICYFL